MLLDLLIITIRFCKVFSFYSFAQAVINLKMGISVERGNKPPFPHLLHKGGFTVTDMRLSCKESNSIMVLLRSTFTSILLFDAKNKTAS